jgi:WG containing repeat
VIDYAGKYIIKPTYKEILHVSEGLFGVKYDNNKLGYVDRKGKVQIPFEYSDIKPFQGGLAIVAKGGKFGIITKFSAKIAPCVFKEITPMAGGNFELVDASSTKYILNSNGDCQTNCAKFDDIRKKANN